MLLVRLAPRKETCFKKR